ncbi:glutamate synthase subunit beta [Gallaecimonas sp. GXIMD4217]|uniref:glutamate synthase subunit beta n=1 Tax=Gallaecimonas sp. GXIMD4217 TaxID=3131927 RepID=UPI00311ABE9D
MKDPLHYLNTERQTGPVTPAEQRRRDFREPQAAQGGDDRKAQAGRCLDCGVPYCQWQCPLHNAIPRWLELARQGHDREAGELCHQSNPLPEVCGRVCPQDRLCEKACTLEGTGFGAVTIGQIERDLADRLLDGGWFPDLSQVPQRPQRVAVIGAGPAGIGCADRLRRAGVQVTLFDREAEIGGLLSYGIPGFKLEKSVIRRRRKVLEAMGVQLRLGQALGEQLHLAELVLDFDAVFLGLGAPRPVSADLPGQSLPGVLQASDYLRDQDIALMKEQAPHLDQAGKMVLVLGGGDTAMDCVRTALRQGAARVTLVYRRDRDAMPGSPRELRYAEEEGVELRFLAQPLAILGEDRVTGVELQRTVLGEADAQGRRRPEPVTDGRFTLACDTLIQAFGFKVAPVPGLAELGVLTDEHGRVLAPGGRTSHPKVFAGGDLVLGADLVVTALAQGMRGAQAILASLGVNGDHSLMYHEAV